MNAKGPTCDIAVIGGGIVGVATAMAMAERNAGSLIVLEAEDRLAAHQTGHNSGVIHSGVYYQPGSLKARLCVEGRAALDQFCDRHDVPHEQCGKVIVAVNEAEHATLEKLERRAGENGLTGARMLDRTQLRELEPHADGVAALHVPETGIVDFTAVTQAMAGVVRRAGHAVLTGARVRRVHPKAKELVLETTGGVVRCRFLVNCAGLESDRVARMCGVDPQLHIVPFRGEYYELVPERRGLVKNLIYPTPDPALPFLGVHFTRMIHGGIEAGPNAVLAFSRRSYSRWGVSPADVADFVLFRGFWRMARGNWRMGVGEMARSVSRRLFVRALRRLVPDIQGADLRRGGVGIRAQAVEPSGRLADDFRIRTADRMVHVLNAPSPAATASIAIGRYVADLAERQFHHL